MKDYDEEIKKIEVELRRLEAQKFKLDKSSTARKKRQRLTFQVGGMFLKYFVIEDVVQAKHLALLLRDFLQELERKENAQNQSIFDEEEIEENE